MTITTGKGTAILKFIVLALACSLAIVAHAADDKKAKEQQEVRKMAHDTLQRLYKAEPEAKGAVEGAAGYAVFSNTGLKIFMFGSGKGEGIAVNNKSKTETFMKVVELQAGLGFGVKKFSVIFVFDNEDGVRTTLLTPAGNSADKPQPRPQPGRRVERWPERLRSRPVSGCIK